MKISPIFLLGISLLFACTPPPTSESQTEASSYEQSFEEVTLLGDSLFSAELPSEGTLEKFETAKAEHEQQPDDPMALIWSLL
ncbi:MAG: hypothetical protein AAF388_23135 [Bacteroidota bacterium]